MGTLNHGLGPLFCCFITLFGAGGTLDPLAPPGAPWRPPGPPGAPMLLRGLLMPEAKVELERLKSDLRAPTSFVSHYRLHCDHRCAPPHH